MLKSLNYGRMHAFVRAFYYYYFLFFQYYFDYISIEVRYWFEDLNAYSMGSLDPVLNPRIWNKSMGNSMGLKSRWIYSIFKYSRVFFFCIFQIISCFFKFNMIIQYNSIEINAHSIYIDVLSIHIQYLFDIFLIWKYVFLI